MRGKKLDENPDRGLQHDPSDLSGGEAAQMAVRRGLPRCAVR